MKIKDIELANVSRYRGELMGAAMLFIILFHVPLARSNEFFGLRRCGNVGVDMFLFLSGIGLWFSWVKNPDVWRFYKRRLLRIYPAWLVMASLYYLPRFDWQFGNYIDLIGDIAINWDFWLNDELTFWYIPAIMMLYLWAPPYMRLIQRHPIYKWLPVIMILWCIWVQWIAPLHQAVGHIEIFWSRVPIFFIGINCGELVRRETKIDGAGIWMVLILFLATFSSCVYLGFNRFCAFFGALSLEAYLIHNHFVMAYIVPYHLGYWLTALLTIVITIPLAWVLQKVLKLVVRV